MNKKEELLSFLNKHLFYPILQSPYASDELKHDFQYMANTVCKFSVEGILIYFWTILNNNEMQMIFYHRFEEEANLDFESFLDQFKSYFTYEWLLS